MSLNDLSSDELGLVFVALDAVSHFSLCFVNQRLHALFGPRMAALDLGPSAEAFLELAVNGQITLMAFWLEFATAGTKAAIKKAGRGAVSWVASQGHGDVLATIKWLDSQGFDVPREVFASAAEKARMDIMVWAEEVKGLKPKRSAGWMGARSHTLSLLIPPTNPL